MVDLEVVRRGLRNGSVYMLTGALGDLDTDLAVIFLCTISLDRLSTFLLACMLCQFFSPASVINHNQKSALHAA